MFLSFFLLPELEGDERDPDFPWDGKSVPLSPPPTDGRSLSPFLRSSSPRLTPGCRGLEFWTENSGISSTSKRKRRRRRHFFRPPVGLRPLRTVTVGVDEGRRRKFLRSPRRHWNGWGEGTGSKTVRRHAGGSPGCSVQESPRQLRGNKSPEDPEEAVRKPSTPLYGLRSRSGEVYELDYQWAGRTGEFPTTPRTLLDRSDRDVHVNGVQFLL